MGVRTEFSEEKVNGANTTLYELGPLFCRCFVMRFYRESFIAFYFFKVSYDVPGFTKLPGHQEPLATRMGAISTSSTPIMLAAPGVQVLPYNSKVYL